MSSNNAEPMTSRAAIRGEVTIDIHDARSRERIDRQVLRNLIPTSGLNAYRDVAAGFVTFPIGIGIGTGTVAAAADDVALGAESVRLGIARRIRPRDGAIRWQSFLPETEGNGVDYTEAGLFNSVSVGNGDLFARIVFGAVEKTSAIFMTITWEHEFIL